MERMILAVLIGSITGTICGLIAKHLLGVEEAWDVVIPCVIAYTGGILHGIFCWE